MSNYPNCSISIYSSLSQIINNQLFTRNLTLKFNLQIKKKIIPQEIKLKWYKKKQLGTRPQSLRT